MTALRAIVAFLGGWRAASFAALLLLALAGLGIQSARLSAATARADRLAADAVHWEEANKSNVAAIKSLREANALWAASADRRRQEAVEAVAALSAERDRLRAELESRRREREVIYARDPSAAAWSREPVPAAVADSLRRHGRQD